MPGSPLNESIVHLLTAEFNFTVNLAVSEVVVFIAPGTTIKFDIHNVALAPIQTWIRGGDNLIIDQMGVLLPHQLTLGNGLAEIAIRAVDRLTAIHPIDAFDSGYLSLPDKLTDVTCYQQYTNHITSGEDYTMEIFAGSIPISMVNVPANLNGFNLTGRVMMICRTTDEMRF